MKDLLLCNWNHTRPITCVISLDPYVWTQQELPSSFNKGETKAQIDYKIATDSACSSWHLTESSTPETNALLASALVVGWQQQAIQTTYLFQSPHSVMLHNSLKSATVGRFTLCKLANTTNQAFLLQKKAIYQHITTCNKHIYYFTNVILLVSFFSFSETVNKSIGIISSSMYFPHLFPMYIFLPLRKNFRESFKKYNKSPNLHIQI